MKNGQEDIALHFQFFDRLWTFYQANKTQIRRTYKDPTRRFLDFNDQEKNDRKVFLRRPQFEALEMYVFLKEYLGNEQVSTVFAKWFNKTGPFSGMKEEISFSDARQGSLFSDATASNFKSVYDYYKKYAENYPNYIYALTMGVGKTILMATCIFYEFLLSYKYPKDPRFCHNAVVFAPDLTVRQSLREIQTFDRSLVIPPEYVSILNANLKFHYLQENAGGAKVTLNTIDGSDFNLVITNTQKVILKKKNKERLGVESLLNDTPIETAGPASDLIKEIYNDENIKDEGDLISNQRFQKLARLSQLGVYVDEAHHMFGSELEKSLLSSGADKTSLRNTINYLAGKLDQAGSRVVGCYNYTGTPYVKHQMLPEVVDYYGLKQAIHDGYLKKVEIKGFDNVRDEQFLRTALTAFFQTYGGKVYENGLTPKMAIFGAQDSEITDIVKPIVEKVLSELGVSSDTILVNIGDETVTHQSDINDFNNLDVPGSQGNKKQVILLVNKGKEGWNCRSLFMVAMFRSPDSRVFVLQATMRCLRKITDTQQKALVFLSQDNYTILDEELTNNFGISIKEVNEAGQAEKETIEVRVVMPIRTIQISELRHDYSLIAKNPVSPIDFGLSSLDLEPYKSRVRTKVDLGSNRSEIVQEIRGEHNIQYSEIMIVAEISRYLNMSCLKIENVINNCVDGVDLLITYVSSYNQILYDVVIPKVFSYFFDVKEAVASTTKEVPLLKEPENADHYSYKALKSLVEGRFDGLYDKYKDISFHADNYCFDSKPERDYFLDRLMNAQKFGIKHIYFTGMFTSDSNGLSIQYIDPESNSIRNYYPDFVIEYNDGHTDLIEVKGDNKIDDKVVQAKAEAAERLAKVCKMHYLMIKSSDIESGNI
jgi:type III restriction enzyme